MPPNNSSSTTSSSATPSSAKRRPQQEERPPSWKVWSTAARPHTLTASLAPNIVSYHAGMALFFDNTNEDNSQQLLLSSFRWLTLQWTAFCMLMQLGTNLHNDYADFVKGADTKDRVGQARATQKGWLSPSETANAAGFVLLMGWCLGLQFLYQMWKQHDASFGCLAFALFIIVTSIFNAFAYTGGPWPLGYIGLGDFSIGYSGLGDLFVFLYFGLVATLMLPFLYLATTMTKQYDLYETISTFTPYAIQVAVLATNIIVVNNLRDRHTDVFANKRTLAVRFGATFCRSEYAVNLLIAYGLQLWMAIGPNESINRAQLWKGLLPLLTLPLAWKEWKAVCRKEGSPLNPHVGGAAKVQLFFCILLAISIRISSI